LPQAVFRWNGDPIAFIEERQLFDNWGRYLGWIDYDNSVWAASGDHIGDLRDGRHVFRTTRELPRTPRLPTTPLRPTALPPCPLPAKIMPLPVMYGWVDGFDLFYPVPPRPTHGGFARFPRR
jgi:hypothetical protein